MFTTHTTRPVRFHGWTLPKGSPVTVEHITIDLPGEVTSVTATTPCYEWAIGLPTYALPREVWTEVPVLRYDHATGRTVPV